MKTNAISPANVRSVLSTVYSAHPNARVREAMANLAGATVIRGGYALSELIAIQRRIEGTIPGWDGVGTNIMANKVVVAFPDSGAMASGLSAMAAAGIPAAALTSVIMPPFRATASFGSYTRPTRAGILFSLQNDTFQPHTMVLIKGWWVPSYYGPSCSLGFNVNVGSSGDYFMTASHCENTWRGANGAIGDSVFQPNRLQPPGSPALVGTITWNVYWKAGLDCPVKFPTLAHYDFCTNADVALGQYVSGQSGERKIGISQYGGVNGNPGSDQINNFYPINAVLSPEYVDSIMRHQVGKSGGFTFTTSGPFVADMMDVAGTVCWGGTPPYIPCTTLSMLWQNHTIIQADVASGDSGGAVFTGNPGSGAPYAALGILDAGAIPYGQLPQYACPACRFAFSRWDQIEARLAIGTLNPQTVF